jgi:hypothetical protein
LPDGPKLISLTFDDALEQHLDKVIPVLNEQGLHGTFYVHLSAPSLSHRFYEWQEAAQAGHELGNHTIFHPADARKSWVRGGNALDAYFPDRMRLEIEVANQWLNSLDGGCPRSFAYPCANPVLGRYGVVNRLLFRAGMRNTRWPGLMEKWGLDIGSTRMSYVEQVKDLFVAARISGLYIHETAGRPSGADRFSLQSAAVEMHSFNDMKGFIERSLAAGGWPILQFHGVGGGHHMDCGLKEFEALVSWLAECHSERVCTVARGALKRFGPTDTLKSAAEHA